MEGNRRNTAIQTRLQLEMGGEEFRFIRERYGLSRKQLGTLASKIFGKALNPRTIYNWERMDKLSLRQVQILRESMPDDMFEEARNEFHIIG